jgi:hypothetical protein
VRPAFPAPLFSRDEVLVQLGQNKPRECKGVFEVARHCLRQTRSVCARERKRRSNPDFGCGKLWIASRSLSSGAHSRGPVARNDAKADCRVRPESEIGGLFEIRIGISTDA